MYASVDLLFLRVLELTFSGYQRTPNCVYMAAISVCVLIHMEKVQIKYIYGQIYRHLVRWEIGLFKSQIVQ